MSRQSTDDPVIVGADSGCRVPANRFTEHSKARHGGRG